MRQVTLDAGDNTWRLIRRGIPSDVHEEIDGRDCYWFRRSGGERESDIYTVHIIPIDAFWSR